MGKFNKLLSLLLASTIVFTAGLTGCGNGNKSKQNSSTTDASKNSLPEAKLKVYGITWSNLFADNQKVMDEVNKLLKQKINATIDYTIDMAADSDKKVPLMIASGEDYDGISMQAPIFQSEVTKGGVKEVGDMLKKYMPNRMKDTTDYDLKDVTYDNKLYGIPGGFQLFLPQGWIIRGDLREKYNIPEVKDLDGLKKYINTLKEKIPDVVPFNTSASDNYSLNRALLSSKGYINIWGALDYQYNSDKVNAVYEYELPEYKDFMNTTKEFNDKGYWSKNAYASKTVSLDSFKAGTSFVATGHVVSANDTAVQLKTTHPDWKVEFARIPDNFRDRPSKGLDFAVPQAAKNPERLMMALELIQTDEEINTLMEYGIKDVHYTLTSDGKVKSTETGIKNFAPDQFPLVWNNRNTKYYRAVEGSVSNFLDFQKQDKINQCSVVNKLAGFVIKKDTISSEMAAMTEVASTYGPVLKLGAFDNTESILKDYSAKMKAAGADKVKAEVQKQIDSFLATKKK